MTHNLWALKHVDRILVMRDGSVAEDGNYNSLVLNKGPFSEFLKEYMNETGSDLDVDSIKGDDAASHTSVDSKKILKRDHRSPGKLVQRTISQEGIVTRWPLLICKSILLNPQQSSSPPCKIFDQYLVLSSNKFDNRYKRAIVFQGGEKI